MYYISFYQILFIFLFFNLVFATAVFFKYAIRRHLYCKRVPGKPPGFFNLLGNLNDLYAKKKKNITHETLPTLDDYLKLFGKYKLFCFWVSYVPVMCLTKAEAIEELMAGTKTLKKGWCYKYLEDFTGVGLITSDGEIWKSHRRLLTPAFHFDILKDFLPVFDEKAQKLISILKKETSKDFTNIFQVLSLCSFDCICETALGVRSNTQDTKYSENLKALSRIAKIICERTLNVFYWNDTIFNMSKKGQRQKKDIELEKEFTSSVIQEKYQKFLNCTPSLPAKKKRKSLMDTLIENYLQTKVLTEEEIQAEVNSAFSAGYDTTTIGMVWTLYLVGLHKEVQEKLHEEMDRIFGNDKESPVTTEDLKDMDYLERVLKESLRIYPPVPFIAREATSELNICGFPIPKDTMLFISIYSIHRDKENFPDPEKFDPDRFLQENSAGRHPFAYIPFSAGARNCIGQKFALMEEKVILSHILRNFTVESLDSRDKVIPVPEIVLTSAKPIRIKLRPRTFN